MNFIRLSFTRTLSVILTMVGSVTMMLALFIAWISIAEKEWLMMILSGALMGVVISCFKSSKRLW